MAAVTNCEESRKIMEDPFVEVEPTNDLLEIATSRLPKSCNIFNIILMAMKSQEIRNVFKFYILKSAGLDNKTAWIVTRTDREDQGAEINYSLPLSDLDHSELYKILTTPTNIINWETTFQLSSLDENYIDVFTKFLVKHVEIPIVVRTSNLYLMDPAVAKDLEIPSKPDIDIRRINTEQGIESMTKYWHMATTGTEHVIRRILMNLPSLGLFRGENLITWITIATNGYFGYLYTIKSERKQSFAKLAELAFMKILGKEGFIPFCIVEPKNRHSIQMHETIHPELKYSHKAIFIFHTPHNFGD